MAAYARPRSDFAVGSQQQAMNEKVRLDPDEQ